MARPLLSAALIVRDEERFLEACLRSLLGRVDEIVVVDTGSTDRSREIAGDLGARLLQFRWIDDFAAARNAAVDASTGQWVLYIDADERVVEFDRADADRLLAARDHACYTVLFRPQSGFTRYREHRIFRNRPELRFRGVIHESLIPALDELVAREGVRVGASSIGLEHDGYDGDIQHKYSRNLPLLEKRLAQDPAHVYSWAHLGATLLGIGDAEGAERAWRRGIDIVRSRAAATAADDLPYLHLSNFLLERRRDATEVLDEACRRFPDNYALLWLRARALVVAARYSEAIPLFARLAAIDPDALCDGPMAFDRSIFGANAHAALGLCAFRLGIYDQSAAHYARAETMAPGDIGIRAKRALAEGRANDAAASRRALARR
ncbi:MAG TPA: glycosyltransferase [Casimicrobiaceae bacterium]|nr:glycosyltransferase [Casimicrobiaceae bacterium]